MNDVTEWVHVVIFACKFDSPLLRANTLLCDGKLGCIGYIQLPVGRFYFLMLPVDKINENKSLVNVAGCCTS
jgi:hypothetical protein